MNEKIIGFRKRSVHIRRLADGFIYYCSKTGTDIPVKTIWEIKKAIKEEKKDWKESMKRNKKLFKIESSSQGYYAMCLLEKRLQMNKRSN